MRKESTATRLLGEDLYKLCLTNYGKSKEELKNDPFLGIYIGEGASRVIDPYTILTSTCMLKFVISNNILQEINKKSVRMDRGKDAILTERTYKLKTEGKTNVWISLNRLIHGSKIDLPYISEFWGAFLSSLEGTYYEQDISKFDSFARSFAHKNSIQFLGADSGIRTFALMTNHKDMEVLHHRFKHCLKVVKVAEYTDFIDVKENGDQYAEEVMQKFSQLDRNMENYYYLVPNFRRELSFVSILESTLKSWVEDKEHAAIRAIIKSNKSEG